MKIELLSDLHHEFYEDKSLYANKEGADVLVVAGDLAVGHDRVWSALKQFANNYEHVVYLPGNHEYYRSSIQEFDDYISRFSRGTNIHFLNPGTVKLPASLGEVTFIGATLWTNFGGDIFAQQAAARGISDFSLIKEFSTDKACHLYQKHSQYIQYMLKESQGTKRVVVTHFLPVQAAIAPEYKNSGLLNKYFANNLEQLVEDEQPEAWLFGHTHTPMQFRQGNTEFLANPYGYNLNKGYKKCFLTI